MFGENLESITFVGIQGGEFTVEAKPGDERWGTTPKRRVYQDKNGIEKERYEFRTRSLDGSIKNVKLRDTEFGTKVEIDLDRNGEGFRIAAATSSSYGTDLMKRLPGVDFDKPVKLWAYDITDKDGKRSIGVAIHQEDDEGTTKLKNYFYDFESKKNLHGFPSAQNRDDMDSDDWKMHFIKVEKFLKAYTTDKISPNFE